MRLRGAYNNIIDETKNFVYRDEALVALRKTARETCKMLNSGTGNFSLCHGLAGNCEILLYGKHVLEKEPVSEMVDNQLITNVANTAFRIHAIPYLQTKLVGLSTISLDEITTLK